MLTDGTLQLSDDPKRKPSPEAEAKLRKRFREMIKVLHAQQGASFAISILDEQATRNFVAEHSAILDQAVSTGIAQVGMSELMRRRISESNYVFSGIKTFHELNEAFPLMTDENGDRKPFERFLNDVQKIDENYNRNYLRAEYNFVNASAEMAGRWEQIAADGDRYDLQYRTAGDDRVRPEHAALNGVTLPPSSRFWNDYYPPNGWNCFVKQTPVLTPQGWRPIEEVQKGDLVVGGSGQYRIVIGTHSKTTNDKLVRIYAKGTFATCTENHRFFTRNGWITASIIKPGDIIVQIGKGSFGQKIINAIHNTYTLCRYALMSCKAERKSVAPLTVDSQSHGRDVKIYNIVADKFSCFKVNEFCRQKIGHNFFRFRKRLTERTHVFGMSSARLHACRMRSVPNIRSEKGRRAFKFVRDASNKLAICFRLALTYMSALHSQLMIGLSKTSSRLDTSVDIINPLRLDSLTTVTDVNAGITKNAGNGSAIDLPMRSKPAIATVFGNISEFRGIANIHTFDRFNSCLNFLRDTFCHNRYILITDKVTLNKSNITVCNLSVDVDESYVVPIGITHNCRCTAVQVRRGKYPTTDEGEAYGRGAKALIKDKKGMFRFNPGKQQRAMPKYNPYTISDCTNCNKIKLASKLPANQLCEVCHKWTGDVNDWDNKVAMPAKQAAKEARAYINNHFDRTKPIAIDRGENNEGTGILRLDNKGVANCLKAATHSRTAESKWVFVSALQNPSRLKYNHPESLQQKSNTAAKIARGVVRYHYYDYENLGKAWTLGFEEVTQGFEQPYFIARKK